VDGVLATLTHAGVSVAALRWGGFPPLAANAAGFCVAFVVSFCGHAFFTFDASHTLGRALRFTVVALTSAALSSGLVLAAQAWTPVPPDVYLPLVALFTPVFNFVVHSLWTFRRPPGIVD
jgi:putative flippase GtrA